jgi:hypothetical protein
MATRQVRPVSLARQAVALAQRFPQSRMRRNGRLLIWRGHLQPTALSRTYLVEVRYRLTKQGPQHPGRRPPQNASRRVVTTRLASHLSGALPPRNRGLALGHARRQHYGAVDLRMVVLLRDLARHRRVGRRRAMAYGANSADARHGWRAWDCESGFPMSSTEAECRSSLSRCLATSRIALPALGCTPLAADRCVWPPDKPRAQTPHRNARPTTVPDDPFRRSAAMRRTSALATKRSSAITRC